MTSDRGLTTQDPVEQDQEIYDKLRQVEPPSEREIAAYARKIAMDEIDEFFIRIDMTKSKYLTEADVQEYFQHLKAYEKFKREDILTVLENLPNFDTYASFYRQLIELIDKAESEDELATHCENLLAAAKKHFGISKLSADQLIKDVNTLKYCREIYLLKESQLQRHAIIEAASVLFDVVISFLPHSPIAKFLENVGWGKMAVEMGSDKLAHKFAEKDLNEVSLRNKISKNRYKILAGLAIVGCVAVSSVLFPPLAAALTIGMGFALSTLVVPGSIAYGTYLLGHVMSKEMDRRDAKNFREQQSSEILAAHTAVLTGKKPASASASFNGFSTRQKVAMGVILTLSMVAILAASIALPAVIPGIAAIAATVGITAQIGAMVSAVTGLAGLISFAAFGYSTMSSSKSASKAITPTNVAPSGKAEAPSSGSTIANCASIYGALGVTPVEVAPPKGSAAVSTNTHQIGVTNQGPADQSMTAPNINASSSPRPV